MKCSKCGMKFDELVELSDYGRTRVGKKDEKSYCEECFNKKYPRLHERTENEKS